MSPFLTVSARSSYKVILSLIKTKLQQCQSLLNAVGVPQTRQWVTLQRPGGWAWSFAQRGHEVPARSQLAALKQTSMTQSALVCFEAFQFQTNFPLHVASNLRSKARSGTWKERCKLRGKRRERALLSPSPAVPCSRSAAWHHAATGSLLLSLQRGDQVASRQMGLNRVITANAITVTFLLTSSLPSEQEICILQSSEGIVITLSDHSEWATKLTFLNTRRTPKSLQKICNTNKWQDCEAGLNQVQQDSICMAPENPSTDLGFSFSIPQLAHETSGPAARNLNTVIS